MIFLKLIQILDFYLLSLFRTQNAEKAPDTPLRLELTHLF